MRNGDYEMVLAPVGYPGKRYRGRYCQEHWLVWWENTGETPPKGFVIHHKNGDKRDNRFSNLEVMSKHKHASMHGYEQGRSEVHLVCPACGTVFVRRIGQTFLCKKTVYETFCSRACKGKGRTHNKKNLIKVVKVRIERNEFCKL